MKVTIITRTARLLEELRLSVEAEDCEIVHTVTRKSGQSLSSCLNGSSCDLLIFESAVSDPKDDLQDVESLIKSQPAMAVIMLSPVQDADSLMAAMRAGIREVLSLSPSAAELVAALRRVAQRKPSAGQTNGYGRVVAFISCKGGSGATFLATNFAHLMATEFHKRTVLIDLDLQFGDASYFMTDGHGKANIADLARQADRLDSTLMAASMTRIAPNFDLLAAPEEPEASIGITAHQIERVLDVARESYEYVVLDFERMLDAVAIRALDKADVVYLVMENMIPYLRDAKRLALTLRALGYPESKLRLIVNCFVKSSAIDVRQIEKLVGLKVDRTLPNSFAEVTEAVNSGIPLDKVNPRNPVVVGLRAMAEEMVGSPQPSERGWIRRFIGKAA